MLFPLILPLSGAKPHFSVMLKPLTLVGGDRNEGGKGAASPFFSAVGDASVGAAVEGSAAPGDSRRLALGLSSGSSDGCRLSDPVISLT